MCGIVGIISKNRIQNSIIKTMNDALVHRGPDDEGFLVSNSIKDLELSKCDYLDGNYNLAFGHRRLAIVDLSPFGHQPMNYLDRYWIVYNGEVYNHIELKSELEALGYSFKSHTDTEVIMASYDAWGIECLNRFNGMWAFVILDIKKNRLFISRDRFGKKPLYYYQDDEEFIFASEIKAILKHPKIKAKPNESYIRLYLESGPHEHLRETAFDGIYRFDNACYLECNIGEIFKPFKETRFFEIKPNLNNEKFDENKLKEYAQKYYELLKDAVRIRLRADVKVGSALSGGLDSSSIVYLINEILKEQGKEEMQETFSSVYKSPETRYCDESLFIDELAKFLNVRSHQIEPRVEDLIEEHKKLTYHFDTPAANTQMSSWHTYKLTKQNGVTVTLDGQGADEQLAGYHSYLLFFIANSKLLDAMVSIKEFWSIKGTRKWLLFGFVALLVRLFFGKKLGFKILNTFGVKNNPYIHLNQVLVNTFETTLETLFHYGDRASMAFSVESRFPFMDYRLVEFLASVPVCYKIHNGYTKYLARIAFSGKLPDNIVWRKDKMGWPIPEKAWFEGIHKEYFKKLVDESKLSYNLKKANFFATKVRLYCIAVWKNVYFRQ